MSPTAISPGGLEVENVSGGAKSPAPSPSRTVTELEPKSAVAHLGYAMLLEKLQRTSDAQAEVRALLGYHPAYIPGILMSRKY